MADALDATLAPAVGCRGRGRRRRGGCRRPRRDSRAGAVAAGALVGATVVSATARPNPAGIPYAPDAYASTDSGSPGAPPPVPPVPPTTGAPPEDDGTSPLVWGAGALALLLLAVVAFLVFQAASGGGRHGASRSASPTSSG